MMVFLRFGAVELFLQLSLAALSLATITCLNENYTYQKLAGYGFVPSNARDKFGDTLGGFGSAIAIDRKNWTKTDGVYTGILWALPDRGWNTQGTLNYQNRVHKFAITFAPNPATTPSPPNLQLQYLDTILFTGPDGIPTTSIDADATGYITYPGYPHLPVATYPGNGFGGGGSTTHQRISIDSEGLILNDDGTFWVSDEYGPYIYKFSATGLMLQAIAPPGAYIPQRNGAESFSSNTPPIFDLSRTVTPKDTVCGRNNNQGLEGLTKTSNGTTLYALLQSALDQEGGPDNPYRRQARLLQYDITGSAPLLTAEYVVTLPLWTDPTESKDSKKTKVAGQSEILSLGDGRFLILSRDSGSGHGQPSSNSVFRHVDIFSIGPGTGATNVHTSSYDAVCGNIASSKGVLKAGITAATYCSFLDYNDNSELAKFGLHNGGTQDASLLNEKWESLALVPVDGVNGTDGQWFLFSLSDNDFITQSGYLNGGAYTYSDPSGYDLDNQALVFQIQLPPEASP